MPENNLVSIQISPEDKTVIMDAITTIKSKLDPLLIALNPDERRDLPKMSDKTTPFVEKALDYAETNPNFVPPYVNVGELKTDLTAVDDLKDIVRPLEALVHNLDDSVMLSGSEAYVAALAFYNSIKMASKLDIPGAKVVYEDLKKRFAQESEPVSTPA